MKYNKLVRDFIPEIIEMNGEIAVTRTLSDEEFKIFLEKKLDEEVAEFHGSKTIEELADILEVLYSLCSAYGYGSQRLIDERLNKHSQQGGFKRKCLLIETVERGSNHESLHGSSREF